MFKEKTWFELFSAQAFIIATRAAEKTNAKRATHSLCRNVDTHTHTHTHSVPHTHTHTHTHTQR